MSATPPTKPTATDPTTAHPEPTQADHDAMFASVVWFREECPREIVAKYYGVYVAILGEKLIDSDPDANELGRRIESLGDAIPVNRVVLQYVHGPEDWNWK